MLDHWRSTFSPRRQQRPATIPQEQRWQRLSRLSGCPGAATKRGKLGFTVTPRQCCSPQSQDYPSAAWGRKVTGPATPTLTYLISTLWLGDLFFFFLFFSFWKLFSQKTNSCELKTLQERWVTSFMPYRLWRQNAFQIQLRRRQLCVDIKGIYFENPSCPLR